MRNDSPRDSRRRAPLLVGSLTCFVVVGCAGPRPGAPEVTTSMTVADILERCVASYDRLDTLRARGSLRDYRVAGATAVTPISLDFARPDHYRFQFGMHTAIVVGDDWWTYDDRQRRFRRRRAFDRTPAQTTSFLMSDGISFLIPALLERGERVFGGRASERNLHWTLARVDWLDQVPCYVIERVNPTGTSGTELQIWIDQDRFLIRGWGLRSVLGPGHSVLALQCVYDEVVVDAELGADRFQLERPEPIQAVARSDGAAGG